MTWQTFLSIAAAACGFASAAWFGAGTVFVKPGGLAKIANPAWKSAPDTYAALASQSAQYLAGALLLLVSFFLQAVATQASIAIVQVLHPILSNTVVLAILLAGLFLAAGWPIYAWRNKYLTQHSEGIRRSAQ